VTDDALVARADHGAVRVLTMNRPAARNALNRELIRSLYAALKAADSDESVRAVVLTGADPAFCAGVDLKEAATFTGGLELALGCDFLIASERAVSPTPTHGSGYCPAAG
jgi:enoyl-CoA hydratase/carnithine racemase